MDYLVYKFSALEGEPVDMQLLPAAEQAIAATKGGQYALVRTLLRRELARRTGLAPREIQFTYSAHGKPELQEQPFNLSHSADCLCIAFHHNSVGVDVERMRPRRFSDIAARFMHPEQLAAFEARGCHQEEFYSCWCAAEALLKHAGDTVWNARQYPFLYHPGQIECLFEAAPRIELFTPFPGYMGAVAYTI